MAPEYLTADDIAKELGVHVQTAQRYFREQGLPGRKIGKSWTTTREALTHWLQGGTTGPESRTSLADPATLETSPIELERKDADDGTVQG